MAKSENTAAVPDVRDSGFFFLRTPLLPMEEFVQWGESLRTRAAAESGADTEAFRQAWREDIELLRARLRELLKKPEIVQALFIASPTLESSLRYWADEPDSKKGLQAERSLVRYFARMCGRATPFGLFSGCSTGYIVAPGDPRDAALSLEPRAQYRPHCRLDFDYLFALTAGLRSDPALAGQLRYWPNSSLRRIGEVWHYVEARVAGSKRSHHLVKLYNDEFLEAILQRARSGARVGELIDTIRAKAGGGPEITAEEAGTYIQDLIRSEVLVSSLTPLVTGATPLDDIIEQLEALPAGQEPAKVLGQARQDMAELDRRGLGAPASDYRAIADSLRTLPAETDFACLFQVDMIKPVRDAWLSAPVLDELVHALEILCRVGGSGEAEEMRNFRQAFTARYERAWVPLEQALDEESGVGFGGSSGAETSPLLRGIQLGGQPGNGSQPAVDLQALLRSRLFEEAPKNVDEIVLDPAELPPAENVARGLADSFDMTVALAAPSIEAVRRGDFRICVRGMSGPPGVRMLGRFCHVDPEIEACVRAHLRMEEAHDEDAVYAEIVYLPEGRLGNVLCRPVLRDYEITYLGRSGAPPERQLPLSDLLVSVGEDGSITLYSQRLHKRVIPRLCNAHGYLNPKVPPVYRFLCYLQHQHAPAGPGFHWGPLESLKKLPRVRVGRVVLACAQWKLNSEEVKGLTAGGRFESFAAVQQLRKERGLPRWVLLVESDNTLPVDLDNPLSVDAMIHVLKRTHWATFQEMYPAPGELCVSGPEGHFHHEILVPFCRRPRVGAERQKIAEQRQRSTTGADRQIAPALRTLPPGSEWLYVKLYGGSATLDDLLTSELPPLLRSASRSGILSRWFFLRYADPHTHLRLRFQTPSAECQPALLSLVSGAFNPLLAAGRIWKIEFDTYQREIERYGGPEAVPAAEDIFYADSRAVLEVLQGLDGDAGADLRWRIALLGVDRLLADFGLDLAGRRTASERLRDGYMAEFHAGAPLKKQLGDRYRAERQKLEGMFDASAAPSSAAGIAHQAFAGRSAALREPIRLLRALEQAGSLLTPPDDLLSTFVHMHVNRMIHSAQRAHELVLYDFLFRIYDGQVARREKSAPPEPAHEPEDTQLIEAGALP